MTSDLCSDRGLIFSGILDNVLDFRFVSNSVTQNNECLVPVTLAFVIIFVAVSMFFSQEPIVGGEE